MSKVFLKPKKGGEGIKEGIRVNTQDDIPSFLSFSETIEIEGDYLIIVDEDGISKVPRGSVIIFERNHNSFTGWNAWCIMNLQDYVIFDENGNEIDPSRLKKA